MNWKAYMRSALVLATVVAFQGQSAMAGMSCQGGAATSRSHTWDFSKEASRLLKNIRIDARQVSTEAQEVRSADDRTTLGWQFQASELSQIREGVNDMGQKLCRLELIRGQLTPQEQTAVDATVPIAKEMASVTGEAISYLNENEGLFWKPQYKSYADNLSSEAMQVTRTARNNRAE